MRVISLALTLFVAPSLGAYVARLPAHGRLRHSTINCQATPKIVPLTDKLASIVKRELKVSTIPCEDPEDGVCAAICNDLSQCSILAPMSILQRLKVGSYFGLWFLLSVGYSITNKRVTNVLPCPWSVAAATVVVGSVFVNALWLTGIRTPPRLPPAAYKALLPIGTFHAIGHIVRT